jgi:hypothetical protein
VLRKYLDAQSEGKEKDQELEARELHVLYYAWLLVLEYLDTPVCSL